MREAGSVGRMKLEPLDPSLRSLLTSPSPATLTLYREGGRAITSPVWFRVDGDWFEIVVAASDRKLDHLRADPRCSLLVFEAVSPFRGVQVITAPECPWRSVNWNARTAPSRCAAYTPH